MKKRYSAVALLACCLITAVLASGGAVFVMYRGLGSTRGFELEKKLGAVENIISGAYIGDADWDAVEEKAADGMIDALGDRWSYYMTPSEYADYKLYSANTTNGIGVTVRKNEESGGFDVYSVADGSPAESAGIMSGDRIVSVAGQSVESMETDDMRALIRAQTGDFELAAVRNGESMTFTVRVETIYTSPVSSELLDGGIGYVRISNFEQGTAEDAKSAIEELISGGAASLIFDVRSNPGGRLTELIELLDYILPEGDIFVSVDKNGEETVYTSDDACIELPMAVLINGDSYSAAEFFAAALSEYGAAELIGTPSTGKGRSQATFELYDGSAVHISTKRYLTPDRIDLSEQGGLTPDIIIENSGDVDMQLQEAIKYLS